MSVCQNIKAVAEARGISIKELSRRVEFCATIIHHATNTVRAIPPMMDLPICRTPMKTIRTIPKRTTVFRLIQATKGTAPYANSTS